MFFSHIIMCSTNKVTKSQNNEQILVSITDIPHFPAWKEQMA